MRRELVRGAAVAGHARRFQEERRLAIPEELVHAQTPVHYDRIGVRPEHGLAAVAQRGPDPTRLDRRRLRKRPLRLAPQLRAVRFEKVIPILGEELHKPITPRPRVGPLRAARDARDARVVAVGAVRDAVGVLFWRAKAAASLRFIAPLAARLVGRLRRQDQRSEHRQP